MIHEFDPWFNFRATQYLADNGLEKFFHWFDYMSWYPLGRPVGSTIYPGMQLSAVAIWEGLKGSSWAMSLNDVCCYIPAWFGVSATLFLGLLTYECSKSANAALAAASIMAIIPAHIMRSVGGGYDNESVAVTALCMTFYFWVRALRQPEGASPRDTNGSWLWGVVAGISYIYMVAAWGGYIFVINMVGVHAISLVFLDRYSVNLHRAYTLFYIIGTAGAIQIPVVGWTPLKSLEQLGPFGVLIFLQLYEVCAHIAAKKETETKKKLTMAEMTQIRLKIFGGAAAAGVVVIAALAPTGYFGPLSSRVRGLFVQHTRTGNPLVDSVAEHQPASADAYWQFMHKVCFLAPVGFALTVLRRTDQKLFLTMYGIVAYYFANKMMRLVILLGPIASALGGMALAGGCEFIVAQFAPLVMSHPAMKELLGSDKDDDEDAAAAVTDKADDTDSGSSGSKGAGSGSKKGGKKGGRKAPPSSPARGGRRSASSKGGDSLWENLGGEEFEKAYESSQGKTVRQVLAGILALFLMTSVPEFWRYSQTMAMHMSNPSIMYEAQMNDGRSIIVDDYREAYWWLRDNTPEDARVMAWWDYGYQITGIGNRTTIADGNTWNHEHIATLGRCLTSPEKEAHRIIRHLADYVLIWTGGGGDDLAKSPHMARIGNSVFHDICPGDPTCSSFGFTDRRGTPTPMMAKSLLYKLHGHNQRPGVRVDKQRFEEAFASKYNKVRIFKVLKVSQKSKQWVADPANRICDAPGSWYCTGQYPPALAKVISKRKNFKQLEDFNVERDELDDEYTAEYHARMSGRHSGGKQGKKLLEKEAKLKKKQSKKEEAAKTQKRDDDEAAEFAAEEAEEAATTKAAPEEPAEEIGGGAPPPGGDDDDDDDDDDTSDDDAQEELSADEIAELYGRWEDSPESTRMWSIVNEDDSEGLRNWLEAEPHAVHIRAKDGRGPLWWAFEYGRAEIKEILLQAGAKIDAVDTNGVKPTDLGQ